MTTPTLPPYIYGREAGENEKVWTETAVREYGSACAKEQMWSITAVRPLMGRQRTHSARRLLVVAASAEHALSLAKDWDQGQSCWFSEPSPVSPVQATLFHSVTPAEFDKLRGIPAQAPKEKPAPAKSKKPLGDTQRAVLRSLKEHGKWPGGWVWNNESQTNKTLESLAQRCLVNREDRGENAYPIFTINEDGLKALADAA